MKNKFLIALTILVSIFIIFCIAVIVYIQYGDNFSLIINKQTEAIKLETEIETMKEIETEPELVEPIIEEKKISSTTAHYIAYDGNVDIEYPVIDGMVDTNMQEVVNKKIYNNAVSIVPLYPISTKMQKLNISSTVNYLDEKKVVIVYEGKVEGYTVRDGASSSGNNSGLVASGVKSDNPSNNYQITQGSGLLPSTIGQNFNSNNYGIDIYNSSNLPTNPLNIDAYPGGVINGFSSTVSVNQNIFYTNTIDLETGKDISLNDVAVPATLAKYARTSKAEIINVDDKDLKKVREYIRLSTIPSLTETLKNSDFRNITLKSWPKSFSYTDDQYIYFTVRLSTKLGNYAIVKYPLNNK